MILLLYDQVIIEIFVQHQSVHNTYLTFSVIQMGIQESRLNSKHLVTGKTWLLDLDLYSSIV